ncbi:hypothetical protein Ahy_B04g073587 [Arachis hypogaea]|uniref:Aminotransferase-like plant mobile domain-containing protein n=1 Tax=Arachis hypogaea TaxID=3818 RepID=A0A444ZQP9_ARAHY|nr:hypothetical protein Ahy_B04g073587 [Arachis hypogaea]
MQSLNRVEEQLRASRFYYVSQIGRIVSHRPTVDALVERWRPETHTFHLPHVTGSTDHSTSGLENECLAQSGVAPGPNDHKGSGIKLAWFRTLKRRQHLTDQASRYDCKDMDGPLAFLLVWAWKRMSTIGPLPMDISFPLARKRRLDDLPLDRFVWDTYSPNRVAPYVILFDISNGANLWSATVLLICFEAVEWHPTDRIRRQFGFHQDPPVEAMKLGASHNIVLTSLKNKNWGVEHAVWILQWLNSSMCVLIGEHVDNYQPSDQYMDWYIGKFGDYLRVSDLAEQEEEGQQEQPHKQEQQPQQEQPPQQQGPPRQERPLVSQSYAYATHTYHINSHIHTHHNIHTHSIYRNMQILPPNLSYNHHTQPYPHYPPPPYTQEYTQPFTHPPYGQPSTTCEAYRPTQAPQGSLIQLLGAMAQDEDQYSTLIGSRVPSHLSGLMIYTLSKTLYRSVHRGIGCRQSPARISMPEGDEAENEDAVDETLGGEDMVDETLADEDEVDQPGTSDDVVGDDSGSDVQGKSKCYNFRVDPARKSRSRWSPSLIKKRVKKGWYKVAETVKKSIFK